MSKTVAFTGKDTLKINGRILNDFGDGDVFVLEFDEALMTAKKGKNGNTIYAYHPQGEMAKGKLRILRTSSDDKFLNNLLALMKNDPAAFALMTGEFTKNVGDGAGNITADTYILSGGVFDKNPGAKDNADGDTEQALTLYTMIFGDAPRTIGG